MRALSGLILTTIVLTVATAAIAQRRGGPEPPPPVRGADDLVTRMMAFDKDGDGILVRTEVTDSRLHRLFDRADTDKDGKVTRAELAALAAKEDTADNRFGPSGGGPPGFPGRPPRPGEVLSPMVRQRLGLSAEQSAQLATLQKEVDTRLESILSPEQRTQLREMRDRGPGGFGGPPGGPGRPRRPPPPPDRP